jgi:hypothetical protein
MGQGRLDVRADVVGVPEGGPHRCNPPAREHCGHRQVRRVSLEDFRPPLSHARTDLVESSEPVVAGVVWMGGPRDPNHPGAACPRRDVVATPGIFIPRAWRDHRVVVT